MSTLLPRAEAQAAPPHESGRSHALAGARGGALGGLLAGALGAVFGRCIQDIAPPSPSTIVPDALEGAVTWGLVAGAAGALAGWVIGPRCGRRTASTWPCRAAFWSSLVASVEAAQVGAASGARAFVLGMVLLPVLFATWGWVRRGLWKARWLLLGWLGLCLVGEAYSRLRPKSFTPTSSRPGEPVVQLGYSPLPTALGYLAVHYHFLTFDPADGEWHRWDLWQYRAQGGSAHWDHVHRDLLSSQTGVGGGPPRIEREWRGEEARAILRALARSAEYPYRKNYLAWPGPNSNTYPAWVLREAGVSADLDPRALGRDYHGRVGAGRTTTATGVQAESAVLGVKVGLEDGVELHFLCFTFGIDVCPPAIKTPLGRVGFPE
ncbi:MAG TPA: DUF3750 domain-containing protein [Gemmataceae bacterium]|nr:DUF3750 domain-containing protein [Gemmataceae bacterium]